MKISFEYLGIQKRFSNKREAREVIEYVIGKENRVLEEIVLIFTDNTNMLRINQEFLKHNYFTDVITFASNHRNYIGGEIFISIDQVRINAARYKTTVNLELFRVIIHGVLHLIGYDDDNEQDRAVMRQKEELYLGIVLERFTEFG